jgi:hypothetical protein
MCLQVSYKKKYEEEKIINFFCILKVTEERSPDPEMGRNPDPFVRGTGSADPDPHQTVTNPQHRCKQ